MSDDRKDTDVEKLAKLKQAVGILHELYGGSRWDVSVDDAVVYDPLSLGFYRRIRVNGELA